jgi:hypothetical protein
MAFVTNRFVKVQPITDRQENAQDTRRVRELLLTWIDSQTKKVTRNHTTGGYYVDCLPYGAYTLRNQ